MDITLERVLSLIPRKPDGKYVHGAKKEFCLSIEAPSNIVNEWERGASKSYNNYLYQIAAKYDVSVEWLRGETDEKKPALKEGEREKLLKAVDNMSRDELLDFIAKATELLRNK